VTFDGGSLEMDRLSATFVLQENVKWSDGEPLTAQDSLFSYQIAKNCEDQWMGKCGGLGLVHGNLSSVENTMEYAALDERRVRWTGYPGFLDPNYRTNFFHPLPQHQIGDTPVEEMFDREETARLPMGWGPYVLEDWEYGRQIVLQKNPYYFRALEGLPRFDRLVFRFTGENSSANIADLLSGDCDLVDETTGLDDAIDYLFGLEAEGLLQFHHSIAPAWEHADFSIGHADYDDGYQPGVDRPDLFGDPRTRQAVALCMDRQSVVDELLFGLSTVPDTYLPPEHPLFNPQAARYAFSPASASSQLEEIGWRDPDGDPATPRVAQGVLGVPDGTPLSFTYVTTLTTYRQAGAQILADSMAQCGIHVKIVYQEAGQLFADPPEGDLFSRRFDMAEFAWLTGARPSCDLFMTEEIAGNPELKNPDGSPRFPNGWKGQNETGYSNPDYDQDCRAALEALPEEPAYAENHLKAQAIFAEDLPVVPLYLRVKMTVTRPDFCGAGMDPTAQGDTWNIEEYGFGEDCNE
jgi:peptide/nickel transport system substrate-binding protein